jgi:hypothetical protein
MLCAAETFDNVVFAGEPDVIKRLRYTEKVFCKIDETVRTARQNCGGATADKNKFFIVNILI